MKTIQELRELYNEWAEKVEQAGKAIDDAPADTTDEQFRDLNAAVRVAAEGAEQAKRDLDDAEATQRARDGFKKLEVVPDVKPVITVDEPDQYVKGGGQSFMLDLYRSQLKSDHRAAERIQAHQEYEFKTRYPDMEKRAVATATLGGIIPPQYLVDLYAKALANGRVYANQANHLDLPEVGMSMIVPRLTVGLSAAVQATESATVATQDPTEVDLTVPIRTIAGYSPVSRQTLERAAYSDQILMQDLVARYMAALDVDCINGSGSGGHILGVNQTAGVSASTASTATAVGIWPKIGDVIQQIETNVGGLGFNADKIIMHPRRYGMFSVAMDTQNRPLMVPSVASPTTGEGVNVFAAGGDITTYGFTGTLILGLPVFTDANIPTNLGGGTNQDIIIVQASEVVHLWERPGDPVTLAFEQQAGTSLQVQLVAYGYAGFTAGRYPIASGIVSGAGLVPPTF